MGVSGFFRPAAPTRRRPGLWVILNLLLALAAATVPARAFEARVLDSVVSVLPLWPGYERGGRGDAPPGAAPEGSAVAIRAGGYLATALHVVERAVEITVRLSDGRELPAALVGRDAATDIAVLKVDADLPVLAEAPEPALGDPVCAVGNPFGLDLSVTCGVVSAVHRSGTGFNPIEDFVQTDATVNPGASGGPLVDAEGRLVGMLSAIFTKESDSDIGVNFAASAALVRRVAGDLIEHGRVIRAEAGLRAAELAPADRARLAGARVAAVTPGGAAARAGLAPGDVITAIGARPVRKPSDVASAFALARPGDRVAVSIVRGARSLVLDLDLPPGSRAEAPAADGCAAPAPVCAARAAVFAVSSYDPLASAVRIAPDALVTSRHVVADAARAEVVLPGGRRVPAEVVPSAYEGDLALLSAPGLPAGPALAPAAGAPEGAVYAVGVAPGDGRVRALAPGRILAAPVPGKALARLHHTAESGPGNSGGALVDAEGRLVGIVAAGGEGINEAVPAGAIAALRAGSGPAAGPVHARLGAATRACDSALDRAEGRRALAAELSAALEDDCPASGNRQLIDLAAQALGRAGELDRARALFERALAIDPGALNARLGLAVTLQLGRRHAEAVPHLERLIAALPEDARVLRMAVTVGRWGGAPALAERALALLERHHPRLAPGARRFLEGAAGPPPAADP